MLRGIVKSDIVYEPSTTRSASPSTAEATSDLATSPGHASIPQRSSVAQVRDRDRYQIINEHGRGGLGRVSRAHDLDLGRDVAIKELISRGHISEVRFLREALITARLEHPGIVPVHEAGRWPDGTPFYAMKLVAGRPLRELIAERTTVDDRIRLLHHVIAVADAIAYAHGRKIIHRDLKPANVIVGEFGETIVIDWGLAKDLSERDEGAHVGGPFRSNVDSDLTSAGSILGTPSYMAPEQERGEQVDQRADVFAIGAMLWELCSLQKVPPIERHVRHRMLRRSGIDSDLTTIIDKALNPDPALRYPDAGSLAADLKAFKSGARIAARRYSPWAILTHWTRRHVPLAASTLGILTVAVTAAVLYVRSVTAERDRADRSEEMAKRARASAEGSLDQLTLKHAQLLLTTDPSAAIDTLTSYVGAERDRANQLRAEAMGRGVSLLRATPHTAMVRWMRGLSDGAIVSLSTDGTLTRTAPDGKSVILTRDVARFAQLSYSRTRHLLAYACDPSNLCIYDVLNNVAVPVSSSLQGVHPAGISFSQNGNLLAIMSRDTTLRVFDVTIPAQPQVRLAKTIRGGADVVFFRDDIVVAGSLNGIEFIHLNGDSQPFAIPNNSFWDASPHEDEFAIATIEGRAMLFGESPIRRVAQAQLCPGPVVGLRFMPLNRKIAFGCREGQVGFWDPQRNEVTSRLRVDGYADLVDVSAEGEYLVAAGGNGIVTVLDLDTDLATTYRGHESRVTAITPPSPEYPFLITADVRGALRAWPAPTRLARVATTLNSQLNTSIFDDRSGTVIATTQLAELTTFSLAVGTRAVGPHESHNLSLVQSGNGNTFAAYGLSEVVELWSAASMRRTAVINTKQGSLTQASFVDESDEIITSGRDGRLVRWTPSGKGTVIAQLGQPIDFFAAVSKASTPGPGPIVFSSFDGALWRSTGDQPVQITNTRGRVSRVIALPDHETVLAGNSAGEVVAINTHSWQDDVILRAGGST